MKRFIKIGLISASTVIVACLLLAAFVPSSPLVRQKPTSQPPTIQPSPTVNNIDIVARDICRDRLISVAGVSDLVVTCRLHNIYGLTGAAEDLSKLTKAVFIDGQVQAMRFVLIGQFRDSNGNSKEDAAITFTVTRSLVSKINWAGMSWIGFARKVNAGENGSGVVVSPGARADWSDLVN